MRIIKLRFPKPYNVFNKQIYDNLFDYSHFIEVWYGGASSGKSYGVVQKVVLKSLKAWAHPRKVLFLRKVDRTVADSIFSDVKNCLDRWQLLELCKINQSNHTITLPNGAQFLFKGMQDPERIKSITGLSDVVMEEASEFTLDDFTQLSLRLRDKRHKYRQIYCMFNPVSKLNWTYRKWFDPDRKPSSDDDRTAIHQSTYKDNRFLDRHNIETIENLKQTNPAYYKIYTLGEFATLDKLVFPNFEKRRLSLSALGDLPSYFGLDFGYTNDETAFMHVKVDQDRKIIYVVEEYAKHGMLNSDIAQIIKQMGYAKEIITADAAEPKSIDEIKRDGIYRIRPAKKGKDSIIQGIGFMQQYRIVVDDRCVKTIEELENYTYKKDRQSGEYTNEPVDAYNHEIDAIRYALSEINGMASPKATMMKNVYF